MKAIRYVALAVAALVLAAVGYYLGERSGASHAGKAPAAGGQEAPATGAATQGDAKVDPSTGRSVLYWHDPMVPGSKFDKPGKSPFMDMQLVPVYADGAGDTGKVTISPRTVQNLGIRMALVRRAEMGTGFAAVGTVSIDERLIWAVQSRVAGYVERLYVRAQFDAVRRGQALAEIYAPEWLAAQEEYLLLRRNSRAGDDALIQAARERLLFLGVSEQQLQAIERSGKASPRVTLYAPETGVVWELGARDGQAVSPGATLFKLAGLGTVWVNAELPEAQAALVKPGSPVEGRAAAMPEKLFKGRVEAVLPDVNPTSRTLKARIVLANPEGALKPGMFASLSFTGSDKAVLLVPAEAVIYTGQRNVVILAEEGGKFRPVDVRVGREGGEQTEIREGLQEGQHVVASGQFLIDSEASLKSALTRMNDPNAPAAGQAATHRGGGKVTAIEGGYITIQHGPIASANIAAMSSIFSIPRSGLPRNIAVGDRVSFEFVTTAGELQLTAIAPEVPEPAQAGGEQGKGTRP